MEILKKNLEKSIKTLSVQDKNNLKNRLDNLMSVYPFNEYEYIISNLLGLDKIKLSNYLEIRDEYLARNEYLHLFEKYGSPTAFGITWAQSHIHSIIPELIKPSKKIEKNYSGEYDFLYMNGKNRVRIEVKASRAVDSKSYEPLFIKALALKSKKPFDMNFQQIKPAHCDVFLWVAVWRDTIKHWVLSSKDVKKNKYYSKGQHRGNTGEGQLHLNRENIKDFKKYEVKPRDLLKKIIKAYKK
ncbi:MAG: hypothetical protein U9O66_03380 [Patescibacteria group bacterium]|nr:hypothetical protein [Patescibacteria group bacterium]